MSIEISIDSTLIQEALDIGHETNPAVVVESALQEYIAHHKQMKLLELFGEIDYEPDHDYKAQRRR